MQYKTDPANEDKQDGTDADQREYATALAEWRATMAAWRGTRRERIATAAMTGILSGINTLREDKPHVLDAKYCAELSINYADALIAELEAKP